MRRLLLSLCLVHGLLNAQDKVSGQVTDGKLPIFAANVYIKSNPEQGTVTDFEGFFVLNLAKTTDTLVVSYLGFRTKTIPVEALSLNRTNVITLKPTSQSLDEVVLYGPDPISDKFSVKKLEKLDIYLNPVAQGDPLKAITILPASTIDDETVNPSLRGSDPDRSRVVFNNVPVYNPVRASQLNNQGFFSLFNTELIDKQYVYASNPPLPFGNKSAGLVEIQTVRELDQDQVKLSASLASTGFFIAQRLKENKTFVQVYGNYQFSGAFLGIQERKLPDLNDFQTLDLGVNARFQINKQWSFNSFSYGIDEDFSGNRTQFTYQGDFESAKTRVFTINNLNYATASGYFNLNFGINTESQEFFFGNTISQQETDQHFLSLNHKTKIGNNVVHQATISWDSFSSSFDDQVPEFFYANAPDSPAFETSFNDTNPLLELSSFTSWTASDRLLISAGLRANLPTADQSSYLSYQMGLRYKLNADSDLLLSGGKYNSYTTPSFFVSQFNLLTSEQLALDYSLSTKGMNITAALFFKSEKGLQTVNQFLFSDNLNTYGFELSAQKRINNWLDVSMAYTLLDQNSNIGETSFPGLRDYGYFIKSSIQFTPPKWATFSLNWLARPGRRYTPITGGSFDAPTGFYEPNFATEFLNERYNPYSRVDFGVSKYINAEKLEWVLFASINNIFNRANQRVDQYNVDYTERTFDPYQLRLLYFGLVLTLNH